MSGKGITSMVTGILSIILCWTGYLAMVLGIIAIVFFCLSNKEKKNGFAITGLVTGIIGLGCSLLWAILYTLIGIGVAAAV